MCSAIATQQAPVSRSTTPKGIASGGSTKFLASTRERLALDAMYEIAKSFSTAPDPIAVLPEILNILSSFLNLRHGALALLSTPKPDDPPGLVNPYMIAATAFSWPDGAPSADAIPNDVAKIVFRSGTAFVSFDLAKDFGEEAVPWRLRDDGQTIVAVPVRDPERSHFVFGVLCAYRDHSDVGAGMSDLDLRVLNMIASLLEQALRFRNQIVRDREQVMADARRKLSLLEDRAKQPAPVALDGIIGDSPAIIGVVEQIRRVAPTKTAVLLRGESGTGKELFARAVHTESDRKRGPFVRVNCAALSETLLESELFGHEKGAFTGANTLKKGRFELAEKGTLFLDEIGEITPSFQAKLLRVLQEGEFERVGGTKTIKVDVRIVAATNKDLEHAVAEGTFRADLYFRICVVPIVLPPLRERPSDIRPLAQLFLDRFNKANGTKINFAPDAFETLCSCRFPGNVRELENCVNRAASLSDGNIVLGDELACQQNSCLSAALANLQQGQSPVGGLAVGTTVTPRVVSPMVPNPPSAPPQTPDRAADLPRRKTANTGRDELIAAMEEAGWVQAKAARLLGMTPRQIAYALQKHDIEIRKI